MGEPEDREKGQENKYGESRQADGEPVEEAMQWFEELASKSGASWDKTPPAMELGEGAQSEPPEPDAGLEDDLSWLEELGNELGPPSTRSADHTDETILEKETDSDPVAITDDIPDDPDEAIDWLERLAREQGSSEGEVEAGGIVDEELEATLAELEDIDMPTDSDEALSWLEELGDQPPVAPKTTEVVVEPETPPQAQDVVAARVMAEMFFAEQEAHYEERDQQITSDEEPEAFQEIIAWLEGLAARQENEAKSDEAVVEPETVEKRLAADAAIVAANAILDADEDSDELGVDDSGPDWLIQDLTTETEDIDLDWMDALEDLDANDLSDREELTIGADLAMTMDDPEPEVETELEIPPFLADEGETEGIEASEVAATAEGGVVEDFTDPGGEKIAFVRAALQAGEIDRAMGEFSALIDESEDVTFLIEELETVNADIGPHAGFKRLLGDAYAKQGDFEKALEQYRQAMDD